jgi:(1->4)-alpha-D-glucan 1-alpha-D-glucosylmutase
MQRVPDSTYRVQLNRYFNLKAAISVVEYLDQLGISDCYLSPIFKARGGSMHGYDITDFAKINSELGTDDDLERLAVQLKKRGMGILLDIVPNHMCVADSLNSWWNDVLEKGPASVYARFFDINWHTPDDEGSCDKLVLPILDKELEPTLANGNIHVIWENERFAILCAGTLLPLKLATWATIVESMLQILRADLGETEPEIVGLEKIVANLSRISSPIKASLERSEQYEDEEDDVKRRFSALLKGSIRIRGAVAATLAEVNNDLHRVRAILNGQAYVLVSWRAASRLVNYRRFFDINDLAALRIEDPIVFSAVHRKIFRLIRLGLVNGLRVDHVDGLNDPEQYLTRLQEGSMKALINGPPSVYDTGKQFYAVVEKILTPGEGFPQNWPVAGTTGYDFLNRLNALFVDEGGARRILQTYDDFTKRNERFDDILYECKKLVLHGYFASDFERIFRQLARIAMQHPETRSVSINDLREALTNILACFSVYRTYVQKSPLAISDKDRDTIQSVVRSAWQRNSAVNESIYAFVGSVLLGDVPIADASELWNFAMRFQQLTATIMAKGLEDTALYRFYPLASLNEVGGNPDPNGLGNSLQEFHNHNLERLKQRPHGLSATSTHDTKRSEDTRARISALSECAEEWNLAVHRWARQNQRKKIRLDGLEVPDSGEEYLLYQTMIGIWPFTVTDETSNAHITERIQNYMIKALREAKVHTNWTTPDGNYESAVTQFVQKVLDRVPDNVFLIDFGSFHLQIACAGIFNSLSQTLLKIACPGIPDIYQGNEIWDFSLVDPDNRRPIDYTQRMELLSSLNNATDGTVLVDSLLRSPEDGRIKLFVTSSALRFRRANQTLFETGAYIPLEVQGKLARHVCAFARKTEGRVVVTAAGRFFVGLSGTRQPPVGATIWGDTAIVLVDGLAPAEYRNVFTKEKVRATKHGTTWLLPLSEVFSHLTVALLERLP